MIRVIHSLVELPPVDRVALVINCSTRVFTSLAIASLQSFSRVPTLIIDCESTDGSLEHFHKIFAKTAHEVFVLSMPLKPHGETLDAIFSLMSIPEVLLMDSDVEILDRDILESMDAALSSESKSYGSGLLQRGEWMTLPFHRYPRGVAWYNERMWVPLTLLRTAIVAKCVEAGHSFSAARDYVEVPGWRKLSHFMSHRFRLLSPIFRTESKEPKILEWDTGSQIHNALVTGGNRFVDIEERYWKSVHHVHGVTRSRLSSMLFRGAVCLTLIPRSSLVDTRRAEEAAIARLIKRYPEYI